MYIYFNSFESCEKLESITVHPDNTVYSSDESGVLFNKDKTELLTYPSGNKQKEYVIPQGVTTIWYNDFANCSKLYIPYSVKTIEEDAFYYSTNITDIYYEGSEADWEAILIGKDYNHLTDATIHFNSNHWEEGNSEENIFSILLEFVSNSFIIIAEVFTKALEFIIDTIASIIATN